MFPIDTPTKTYVGLDGKPLEGGYVYFGSPNQNPETSPITAYWDVAGTQPVAQPVRIVGGQIVRNGNPAKVFIDVEYSTLVRDSNQATIFYGASSTTFDAQASIFVRFATWVGATLIGFLQQGIGAVLRTLASKLYEHVSPTDFGAKFDGVTDDILAWEAAIVALNNGGLLLPPRGVSYCSRVLYVPYGVGIWGKGSQHTPDITALTSQGTVILGKHGGPAVVSLKGAYMCKLMQLCIMGMPATPGDYTTCPKTGLAMGRSSAASAGRHMLTDTNVVGYFQKAAYYSIASEENVLIAPKGNVLGGGAQFTFFTAESDSQVVDSMVTGSNFTMYVNGFNMLHQADYTGQSKPTFAIYVQAGANTQSLNFNGGFTGMTSQCTDSSHIRVQLTATTLGDISFRDIGCESSNSAAPPIQNIYLGGAGFVLPGFVADNVGGGQVESGQTYHIKAQGGLELNGARIRCSKTDHPTSLSIVRKSDICITDQDLHIDYISEGNILNARQVYLIETAGGDTKNNISLSPTFIGPIAFGGGAVNDMSIDPSSIFTGTVSRGMVVYIDASTTPNTFKWSHDGGSNWVATGINITGGVQALSEGIAIKFVATTGHATGSQWSWTAQPNVQFA